MQSVNHCFQTMLFLIFCFLCSRQVLSADSPVKNEFTREQFGLLQLGSVTDSLSIPMMPTRDLNQPALRMMAGEIEVADSNLEGYLLTGMYTDDKCSTLAAAGVTPLNTCVNLLGFNQLVTATSTKITMNLFSDSECKESTMSMTWPSACGHGMKFSYSPTKTVLPDRPYVTRRSAHEVFRINASRKIILPYLPMTGHTATRHALESHHQLRR